MRLAVDQHRTKLVSGMERVRARAFALARRVPPGAVDIDDLISAGNMAVLEALDRATDDRSFECYLGKRVRGAMIDELRRRDPLSRDERDLADRVLAAETALAVDGGAADDEALARHLAMPLDAVRASKAAARTRRLVPIDVPDAAGLLALADRDREALPHQIDRALKALPERSQAVVRMRYFRDRSLVEIAKVLGVTESRACQLVAEAVKLLRAEFLREGQRPCEPEPIARIAATARTKVPKAGRRRESSVRHPLHPDKARRPRASAAKPTHYKVLCISMYVEDLAHVDAMVSVLKGRGMTNANRSALIRLAISALDVDKVRAGVAEPT